MSQGIPMILMGDEVGRTQRGNNNTYCHDNELNWFDWRLVDENADLLRFFRTVFGFRHAHPALRSRDHLRFTDYVGAGLPDISWHGTQAWRPDWSAGSRVLAFLLSGRHAKGGVLADDDIYVAASSHWDALEFELPQPSSGRAWHVAVNTSMPSPADCFVAGQEPRLENQSSIWLGGRSVMILVAK